MVYTHAVGTLHDADGTQCIVGLARILWPAAMSHGYVSNALLQLLAWYYGATHQLPACGSAWQQLCVMRRPGHCGPIYRNSVTTILLGSEISQSKCLPVPPGGPD